MSAFAQVYPVIVLLIGSVAAFGAIVCGLFVAVVLISAPFLPNSVRDSSDLSGQAFLSLFALATGCFGAIGALAFTKWVLGV